MLDLLASVVQPSVGGKLLLGGTVAPKIMLILRGLPGSGKTNFVLKLIKRLISKDVTVCSADSFFYHVVGGPDNIRKKYRFNPSLLSQAHQKCMQDAMEACSLDTPLVVIDNTCSTAWEYKNYELVAEARGYKVLIYEIVPGEFLKDALGEWFNRQQHGVPLEVFLQMWWRWKFDPRATYLTSEDTDLDKPLSESLIPDELK